MLSIEPLTFCKAYPCGPLLSYNPSPYATLEGLSEGNGCLLDDEYICKSYLFNWSFRKLWVTVQDQLWKTDQLIGCCCMELHGWMSFCQQVRGSLGANLVSSITAGIGIVILILNLSHSFAYMNYCRDLNEDDGCFVASFVTVCISWGNADSLGPGLSVKPHFFSRDNIPHLEFPSHRVMNFEGFMALLPLLATFLKLRVIIYKYPPLASCVHVSL